MVGLGLFFAVLGVRRCNTSSYNPILAELEDLKSMFAVAFCSVMYAYNYDFSWSMGY